MEEILPPHQRHREALSSLQGDNVYMKRRPKPNYNNTSKMTGGVQIFSVEMDKQRKYEGSETIGELEVEKKKMLL